MVAMTTEIFNATPTKGRCNNSFLGEHSYMITIVSCSARNISDFCGKTQPRDGTIQGFIGKSNIWKKGHGNLRLTTMREQYTTY